jgi:hypothetical protein
MGKHSSPKQRREMLALFIELSRDYCVSDAYEMVGQKFGFSAATVRSMAKRYGVKQAPFVWEEAAKAPPVREEPISSSVDAVIPAITPSTPEHVITKPRTYIITGWEIRVGVDYKFVNCLRQLAAMYDAELMLAPVWLEDLRYLPAGLHDFTILKDDFTFNTNLKFKYVPTHALVMSPLAGWRGAFEHSTIVPGLVKELQTEPSPKYAKQLMSTGSIGRLDASIDHYDHIRSSADEEFAKAFGKRWHIVTNRVGGRRFAIGQNYTVPSALLVHVIDEKIFLTRYVTMPTPGVVHDLNHRFTAGKKEPEVLRPEALAFGDTHAIQVDPVEWSGSLEMVRELNPRSVIVNDFFDGASCNHHEIDSAVKFHTAPSIRDEAEVTRQKLLELAGVAERVIYLHSNHDDFILKVLDKGEPYWRLSNNYAICCELQAFRVKETRHPIIHLLDLDSIPNVTFVDARDNHMVGDVTVNHGHQGVSGRRAGFVAQAKIYNYLCIGHTHNPAVYRNAINCGTDARRDMSYLIGASGIMAANGLIHADNSLQLLPKINGRWRL